MGVIDLVAIVLVIVVVALPKRDSAVHDTFDAKVANQISASQTRLATNPGDGDAASKLALGVLREGARRVAETAAGVDQTKTRWQSLWALSSVHVARFDVPEALRDAKLALAACEDKTQECPEHQHIRLQIWVGQLSKGLASGIDPRLQPKRFKEAMRRAFPRARIPGP
jgi:hypothetical protein